MTASSKPLCLVFQVSASGQGSLLPLDNRELRAGLGLRPMALAEVAKEMDRPCFAFLSEDEDLLARVFQLAGRCGLKGSTGAITPPPVPSPDGAGESAGLLNGVLISGPRGGFEKVYEVLALSGNETEGRLARAGERALLPQASRELRCGDKTLRYGAAPWGGHPLIQGILNVTPDSFSDGGRYAEAGAAIRRAREMIEEGAGLIDVGGESSRPGSEPVSVEEECRRVLPVIEALAPGCPVPISIDTTKAEVARRAVAAGASLINDISGMTLDPLMPALAATLHVPVILNHLRGIPKTMQESPSYDHVVLEVLLELAVRVRAARAAGVEARRIVVDPGVGFGKSVEDNLALIRHLGVLRSLACPILVGLSRKSFLGAITGREVGDRLEGTVAAETVAALAGAEIIRTHEPAAARDAIRVARAMAGSTD